MAKLPDGSNFVHSIGWSVGYRRSVCEQGQTNATLQQLLQKVPLLKGETVTIKKQLWI